MFYKKDRGYLIVSPAEAHHMKPEVIRKGNNVIIKGISLSGDTKDFCSYKEAIFAYLRLAVQFIESEGERK